MKFLLTVSTNGVSTRLYQKRYNFCPFWVQVRMCLDLIGGEFSSNAEMVLLFHIVTRFSCKTMFTVTAKQHNCSSLVLKRIIQKVAAGFALFTVGETSCFIG